MNNLRSKLSIGYSVFKNIITTDVAIYWKKINEQAYDCYITTPDHFISCSINNPTDLIHFVNNYKENSFEVSGEDDAIALGFYIANQNPVYKLPPPRTSDGKPILLPDLFAGPVRVQHLGAADNIDTGVRGAGDLFVIESTSPEDVVFEFQLKEWIYLAGGQGWVKGGEIGDYATFGIYAPATTAESTPGTGNFNKVPVASGLNMFVPTSSGNWTIDLSEKLSPNVNLSKAVPVPSSTGQGFIDWDPTTEILTVNSNTTGGYNLFDAPIPIWNHVEKIPLYNNNHIGLTVPAVKVKRILGQWKHKITLHHTTSTPLGLAFSMFIGRP